MYERNCERTAQCRHANTLAAKCAKLCKVHSEFISTVAHVSRAKVVPVAQTYVHTYERAGKGEGGSSM